VSPEPRVLAASELTVGLLAEFERDIAEEDVLAFAALSGDHNPLHVDAVYARSTNYQSRIVHGAFQVGLASAMLGMYLPGRNALFGAANARFSAPLYFPCRVRVRGEITAYNKEERRGTLAVIVREHSSLVTTAEVLASFTLHEQRRDEVAAPMAARPTEATDRRIVLVTGASGGLGGAIVADLARGFSVLAMVNRAPLDLALKETPHVVALHADLRVLGWEERVLAALEGRGLYAIVHAAWPGLPTGGLLATPDDVIDRQVAFGTHETVRLARLLFASAAGGGRLIVLGSIAGSQRPTINAAAYSLGKAALEHTVRLLAPELARKGVTINAICPTFVPVGMNKHANERQRLKEAALVPMGRLCTPADVTGLVGYLLSDEAAFVSGQIIALSGAQL
jgi:NAD(P)-dependent dehydrogenase (short-subunit alcohol dehydrogenase family)/acyl dehydratase